jgi:hypothetical protein
MGDLARRNRLVLSLVLAVAAFLALGTIAYVAFLR